MKREERQKKKRRNTAQENNNIVETIQTKSKNRYVKYFAHGDLRRAIFTCCLLHSEFANERPTSKEITEVSLITIKKSATTIGKKPTQELKEMDTKKKSVGHKYRI